MKTYALALSALIAFSGAAIAADTTTTVAKTTTVKTTKTKTVVAPKALKARGEVVSVDAVANTLTLKGHKKDAVFTVAADAKITEGKKDVKLADIAAGSKVSVTYMKDGATMTASAVKIMPAKAVKAAKAPKAAK